MLGETEVECDECRAIVPIDQAEYVDCGEHGGYWRCDRCFYDDWYESDGWEDEDDELEYWLSMCGQQRDGTCLNAGTEECDFECPFRDDPLLWLDDDEPANYEWVPEEED